MVITMELKRVILRGRACCFLMPVPRDCVKAIGKTETVVSLKTKDPLATKTVSAGRGMVQPGYGTGQKPSAVEFTAQLDEKITSAQIEEGVADRRRI